MEAEAGDRLDDWAGAPAGAPVTRKARGRDVLRVGRVAVPVAAAAWAVSLTAHAGALLVGLAVLRHVRSDSPPAVQFAGGSGGTTFGVYREAGGGVEPLLAPEPSGVGAAGRATGAAEVFQLPEPHEVAERAEALFPTADAAPKVTGEELADAGWFGIPPSVDLADGRGGGIVSAGTEGRASIVATGESAGGAIGTGINAGAAGGRADGGAASDGAPGIAGGEADARLPAPVYPREARLRGEQGTVVLEVEVSADGRPVAVRVVDDAGYPRLAASAVAAAKKARFRPAYRGGAAVAAVVRIPFRFTLRPDLRR